MYVCNYVYIYMQKAKRCKSNIPKVTELKIGTKFSGCMHVMLIKSEFCIFHRDHSSSVGVPSQMFSMEERFSLALATRYLN